MYAPSVTYPLSSILEWYDSLAVTISGYADPDSVTVEVNGNAAVYDTFTNEWSYSVTLSGYETYDFTIISKDSLLIVF